MKGAHWLWLALTLSVLFNMFVVAGYMQAGAGPDDPSTQAADVVASELQLDEAQRSTYHTLHDDYREESGTFEDKLALIQESMLEEFESDAPDIDRVMELIDGEAELHRTSRMAAAERLKNLIEVLSPEQRQKLHRKMRRGPGGPRHRRDFLAPFDVDGDGRLDAQERAAANAAIRERQREREGRPPHPFADRNGDGTVDPEEEAEARGRREMRRSKQQSVMRLQLVARFDADEDGTLSDEELDTLRAWLEEPIELGPSHDGGGPDGQRRPRRGGGPGGRGGPGGPGGGPPGRDGGPGFPF